MVSDRLKQYIESKSISYYSIENSIGVARGTISKAVTNRKNIGSNILENILAKYKDLNPTWLLTGEGQMLRLEGDCNTSEIQQENIIDTINSSDPKLKEYTLFNTINNMSKAMLINAEAMMVNARANEKTSINMEKLINLLTPKE